MPPIFLWTRRAEEGLNTALCRSPVPAGNPAAVRADLSRRLADACRQWPELLPDDAIWKRATEAEAIVLCRDRDCELAVRRYQAALEQACCQDHHPRSMGTQLRRIFDGYSLLNEPVPLEPFQRVALMWPYLQPESAS